MPFVKMAFLLIIVIYFCIECMQSSFSAPEKRPYFFNRTLSIHDIVITYSCSFTI